MVDNRTAHMYFRTFLPGVLIFVGIVTIVLWFIIFIVLKFAVPGHPQIIEVVAEFGFLFALPVLLFSFLAFKFDPMWITRLPFTSSDS